MYTSSNDSEIYIGRAAGKDLYETLANAKSSIKVLSPYLTASLVSELVRLQKAGIDVMLITSDNIEDYKPNQKKESILYEVVTQVRKTNKTQKAKKIMFQTTTMILYVLTVLLVLSAIASFLFYENKETLGYSMFGSALLSLSLSQVLKGKIKGIRIYSYSYQTVFPIKVYYSPYNRDVQHTNKYFIHSKVYIIDGKVAFLGSLNFTSSGLKNNYETSIKVRDKKAVYEINKEYDKLFHTDELQGVDFELVGRKIYKEQVN